MTLMQSIIAALTVSAFLYSFQKAQRFFKRRAIELQHGCQKPRSAPSRDPFFGLDSVYRILRSVRENRRNTSLKDQLDAYGYTFVSNLFGNTEVFSAEPRNLQAVFATDFESFGVQPIRLFVFHPLIGKGIMTMDGDYWANFRAQLQPIFARAQINDLSSFDTHVTRLIDLIPKDRSTVDLQPLFARLALDSSSEFLFGESLGLLSAHPADDSQRFWQAYQYAQAGVGKRLQLPRWNIFTRDRKFWVSCDVARVFVESHVDKALLGSAKEAERAVCGLSAVTQNRDDIRDQLLNVFLPAHDAIAVALTNVFFNLARHPDVWGKLCREILSIGSEKLTFERLKSLSYLQFVIKETLRLYPTVGSVGRIALRDVVLPTGGGKAGTSPFLIKKGEGLRTSFYALHRRKDIYGEDAAQFKPERWAHLRPPHWAYLPFGGGPRTCPGQQLGLAQVSYTVVRLLRVFENIENRDPILEFIENYKITTESKNGAKVCLVPAQQMS